MSGEIRFILMDLAVVAAFIAGVFVRKARDMASRRMALAKYEVAASCAILAAALAIIGIVG